MSGTSGRKSDQERRGAAGNCDEFNFLPLILISKPNPQHIPRTAAGRSRDSNSSMVRIQLNLAPTASSSTKRRRLDDGGADDASSSTSSIPRPLLALSPNGELILVELQGSLEMDDQGAEEGQSSTIGELIWGEGREVSTSGVRGACWSWTTRVCSRVAPSLARRTSPP